MADYQSTHTGAEIDAAVDNIKNQDLTAAGFTPVANTYYKHTGTTNVNFTQGIIYFYNGEEYKAVDGSGSGSVDLNIENGEGNGTIAQKRLSSEGEPRVTKSYQGASASFGGNTQAGKSFEEWLIDNPEGTEEQYNATFSFAFAINEITKALGRSSFSQGMGTVAKAEAQAVFGAFNDNKLNNIFEIGNGTSDENRSNAFEVTLSGRARQGAQTDDNDNLGLTTVKYVKDRLIGKNVGFSSKDLGFRNTADDSSSYSSQFGANNSLEENTICCSQFGENGAIENGINDGFMTGLGNRLKDWAHRSSLLGVGLISRYTAQTNVGKYNDNKSNTLFEVGNGTDDTHRSNAFEVQSDGTIKCNKLSDGITTKTMTEMLAGRQIYMHHIVYQDSIFSSLRDFIVLSLKADAFTLDNVNHGIDTKNPLYNILAIYSVNGDNNMHSMLLASDPTQNLLQSCGIRNQDGTITMAGIYAGSQYGLTDAVTEL